jgi:hypothetical protein
VNADDSATAMLVQIGHRTSSIPVFMPEYGTVINIQMFPCWRVTHAASPAVHDNAHGSQRVSAYVPGLRAAPYGGGHDTHKAHGFGTNLHWAYRYAGTAGMVSGCQAILLRLFKRNAIHLRIPTRGQRD